MTDTPRKVWRQLGGIWWYWTIQSDGRLGYPLGHQPTPPTESDQ